MIRRLNAFVVALALASLIALPGAASADTVQIGSSLSEWDIDALSTGTGLQISQAGGSSPLSLTSTANGTVTSWAIRAGTQNALYSLRVLRPNGGTTFTPVATVQAPTAIPVMTPAPGTIYEYPASVPIQQGDAIGIRVDAVAGGLPVRNVGTTATDVVGYGPSNPDGTPIAFSTLGGNNYELQLRATIRFCKVPRVVGQAQAAAAAAIAAAECTSTVSQQTQTLRRIKKSFSKKKKKRIKAANAALRAQDGTVLVQGTAPDATVVPGTAVALTVAHVVAPPKKKKKKGK